MPTKLRRDDIVDNMFPQDLDMQYTLGVATDVPITEFFVGPNTTDEVEGFRGLAHRGKTAPSANKSSRWINPRPSDVNHTSEARSYFPDTV